MKKLPRILCALLVPIFLFAFHLPAKATTVPAADSAAKWLEEKHPAPTIGDELVLFTLLRGGYVTGVQPYTQNYLLALSQHAQSASLQQQNINQSAWQLMVLAAAGVNIETEFPLILNHFTSLAQADSTIDAQYLTLLVFGAGGVPLPESATINLTTTAVAFGQTHNEDGGFGANGQSTPAATAQALQVLSFFGTLPELHDILFNAQVWQQQNASVFGGFDEDGKASARATAEAILSISCLGYDPAFISAESASMIDALFVFQQEDGSFVKSPDDEPNTELTAYCTLALVAKNRFDRGSKSIFDCSDALKTSLAPQEENSGTSPSSSTASLSTAGDPANTIDLLNLGLPAPFLLGGFGAILVLVAAVAIISTRSKSNRKNKWKHKGQSKKTSNKSASPKSKKYTYRK